VHSRRAFLGRCAAALAGAWLAGLGAGPLPRAMAAPIHGVRAHGARGDGRTNDTRALQAAIDAAGRSGGTVRVPPGEYLSGTLRLRSRVTVHLEAGAVLVASRDDGDFDPVEKPPYETFADVETSDFRFALLQGHGLRQVRIVGAGRIDGNRWNRSGPKPIALRGCRDVVIRDITLANAGNYNVSLLGCEGVDIEGLTIVNGYSDGIDPDCCQHVRIRDCRIESRDDAIVLKASLALGVRGTTRYVRVSRCHLTTLHNGLKLGTESAGDFRDISFTDCTVVGRPHTWKGELSSGLAITTVDGGTLERVSVSDIRMTNVRSPIFVRLGERGRGQPVGRAGILRKVSIARVEAVGATIASSITGVPGRAASEISLRDIRLIAKGGGEAQVATLPVPELEKTYPDAYMFRDLPAYGLYARHVEQLELEGIELGFEQPDARPALVLDNVRRVRVRGLRAMPAAEGEHPLLWLRSVRDGVVADIRPQTATRRVVRLSGLDTTGIRLASELEPGALVDPDLPPGALVVAARPKPAAR
jgi:Glycosyl hydrolases family 28